MNKMKKILTSIGVFINVMISKVYAVERTIVAMYAADPGPRQNIGDTISKIGKIAIPVVLFIIGLIVILNKKIAKKVKAIIISILAILAILGIILMNYISINF